MHGIDTNAQESSALVSTSIKLLSRCIPSNGNGLSKEFPTYCWTVK